MDRLICTVLPKEGKVESRPGQSSPEVGHHGPEHCIPTNGTCSYKTPLQYNLNNLIQKIRDCQLLYSVCSIAI